MATVYVNGTQLFKFGPDYGIVDFPLREKCPYSVFNYFMCISVFDCSFEV